MWSLTTRVTKEGKDSQLTVCLFCLASHEVGGAKNVRLTLRRCAADDLAVSRTLKLLGPFGS